MNTCLQRQATRYFWWPNGQNITDPAKQQVLEFCSAQWNSFAVEKLVSWAVYSLVSVYLFFFNCL
jgi:hypothetical protein